MLMEYLSAPFINTEFISLKFTDRCIIIGAHYDSWTYGAMDPNSGTSVIMEVAKALGSMTEKGNDIQ